MKESLKQAGRFFPTNAEAAKVLQPAERAFDGPAAPVTAQGAAVLSGATTVGSMRRDHLDVLRGECGIERVAIVSFVSNDPRRHFAGDHEVEEPLDETTLVRSGCGGVGGHGQACGVDQQHDLDALAHPGDANAIATLARLTERGVDKALVEFEATALFHAPARRAHDALEDPGFRPAMKPIVDRAFGPELRRQVLPLRPIIQNPKDPLPHLTLVRGRATTLGAARDIWDALTYPIELCISKLKHSHSQLYPCQTYNEVFG